VTDLRVSYDLNFSFRPHIGPINNIVANASLKRIKAHFEVFQITATSGSRAFCTVVRSVLEFSSVIYSPYYCIDIHTVEKVQRRDLPVQYFWRTFMFPIGLRRSSHESLRRGEGD